MRIERHVVARKKQQLVALPARLREHLDLSPGQAVYWHIATKGQAILTVSGRVRAGRPRDDADCPSCGARQEEIARLRARDVMRDRALYAEGHSAGYMQAHARLTDPQGPSATRGVYHRAQAAARDKPKRRHRRAQLAQRQVEGIPTPVLAPPSGSSDGGASP